ncbi:MAG: CerR family C-terminal domain-containing protein, partial [Pseudomonadota bacterium]
HNERAPDPRTDKTRMALISVGMRLAARQGFDNTSVRQIADEAGVNLAAINYHFGGKEGLRVAVIDDIGRHMREHGPGFYLRELPADKLATMEPEEAKAVIRKIMVVGVKTGGTVNELADMPAFIHREIFGSGEQAAYFFERIFRDEHALMAQLVSRVTGTDPEASETRLKALMIIGQSVFANIARGLVCSSMGWTQYGDDEMAALEEAFWVDTPQN